MATYFDKNQGNIKYNSTALLRNMKFIQIFFDPEMEKVTSVCKKCRKFWRSNLPGAKPLVKVSYF